MSEDEDEIPSDSKQNFTPREWVHPLDRYLEACTQPEIQGYILLQSIIPHKGSPNPGDQRCFFLTAHFTREKDLPQKLHQALSEVDSPNKGMLLAFVRPYTIKENGREKVVEGPKSLASFHILELWLAAEIRAAWEKFCKTKSVSNTFLCALEFLRRVEKKPDELRDKFTYQVGEALPIREQNSDRYWEFLTQCQDYLASDSRLKLQERQFGHITDWLPNSKLPEFEVRPRWQSTPTSDDEPVMGLLPPADPPALQLVVRADTEDRISLEVPAIEEPAPPPLRTIHRGRPVSLGPKKK